MKKNNQKKEDTLEQTATRLFNEINASVEKVATSFMQNALKFVTDIFHVKTMCAMTKANKLLLFVIAGYIFLYAPLAAKIMLTVVPVLWLLDYFDVNLNFSSDKKEEKKDNDEVKVEKSTETESTEKDKKEPKNISEISDGFIAGAERMFSTFLKRAEEFVKDSFDDKKTCDMSFANKLLRMAVFGTIIVKLPILLKGMLVIIIALWIAEYFEVEISFTKKTEKDALAEKDAEIEELTSKVVKLEEAIKTSMKLTKAGKIKDELAKVFETK